MAFACRRRESLGLRSSSSHRCGPKTDIELFPFGLCWLLQNGERRKQNEMKINKCHMNKEYCKCHRKYQMEFYCLGMPCRYNENLLGEKWNKSRQKFSFHFAQSFCYTSSIVKSREIVRKVIFITAPAGINRFALCGKSENPFWVESLKIENGSHTPMVADWCNFPT